MHIVPLFTAGRLLYSLLFFLGIYWCLINVILLNALWMRFSDNNLCALGEGLLVHVKRKARFRRHVENALWVNITSKRSSSLCPTNFLSLRSSLWVRSSSLNSCLWSSIDSCISAKVPTLPLSEIENWSEAILRKLLFFYNFLTVMKVETCL